MAYGVRLHRARIVIDGERVGNGLDAQFLVKRRVVGVVGADAHPADTTAGLVLGNRGVNADT